MALVKISGPVGNFREETKVTSTHTYNTGHTNVRTENNVSFRVGNRPVTMKNINGRRSDRGRQQQSLGRESDTYTQ